MRLCVPSMFLLCGILFSSGALRFALFLDCLPHLIRDEVNLLDAVLP
jgi:hypothetical protein